MTTRMTITQRNDLVGLKTLNIHTSAKGKGHTESTTANQWTLVCYVMRMPIDRNGREKTFPNNSMSQMFSLKTLFLIFALVCVTAMAQPSMKSSKSPTMKSSKSPSMKMSKKTKSPSYSKGSKLSTKSPTMKSSKTPKSR
eukprot:scaffold1677_cov122-Cylindrotheca_fusiformis.AAC.4